MISNYVFLDPYQELDLWISIIQLDFFTHIIQSAIYGYPRTVHIVGIVPDFPDISGTSVPGQLVTGKIKFDIGINIYLWYFFAN